MFKSAIQRVLHSNNDVIEHNEKSEQATTGNFLTADRFSHRFHFRTPGAGDEKGICASRSPVIPRSVLFTLPPTARAPSLSESEDGSVTTPRRHYTSPSSSSTSRAANVFRDKRFNSVDDTLSDNLFLPTSSSSTSFEKLQRRSSCRSQQSVNSNNNTQPPGTSPPPQTPEDTNLRSRGAGSVHSPEYLGIKPELYKQSAEVDLPPSRIGRVWFKLVYDGAVETLTVEVLKVKQLLPRHHNNNPRDSFVKLFLLPDERFSQQTKVRQRTNNPKFNEKFVFQVSNTEIKRRCLRLSVYDAGKGMRHLLGHALVSLSEIDPSTEEELLWRDLDDIAHSGDTTGTPLGELNIGLSFIPKLNRLNVIIVEARNLRKVDLESSGIFVKIALTKGHSVIKTKQTTVQEGALDPHYNESFSFKIPPEDIDKSCLSIMVLTTCGRGTIEKMTSSVKNALTGGRCGGAHKYGRVAIGSFMYCRGEQLLHWQDAISQSCQICTRWHPLSEVLAII